jgi:predicted HTH transcriptional regulator
MTIEDMIFSESKNIEFKEMLPKDSEKFIKTIIAFANTQGGSLIIGVEDGTRTVKGIEEESIFRMMDSISNAVSDSCVPQIIPNIEPYTINGRNVIVVTVAPGPNRPYYIKSKGKEHSTYIRVGATSRLASPEKIKELEYEGEHISWDELTCIGYTVTEEAIEKLCNDMNHYRQDMQQRMASAAKLSPVTKTNLINWNILKDTGDGYLASNAFALLTGTHFRYSKTQCALFAGTDRGDFLDKCEYTGPLYEQIEAAYTFVLRNIRRHAKVEGLIRREDYELPPSAIREMIINAHCHRNFLDPSCVQVALYDDRLEVTSPGGLCYGLTLEEALSGRSRQRNRAIAEVFNQMGLIESWGNGLRDIQKTAKLYHLPEPEFIEMPDTFRVNLYFDLSPTKASDSVHEASAEYLKNVGRTSVEMQGSIGTTSVEMQSIIGRTSAERQGSIGTASIKRQNIIGTASVEMQKTDSPQINATQKKILNLLLDDPKMTGASLATTIGISKRNIEINIRKLKEIGLLIRHGSNKGGYWEVR